MDSVGTVSLWLLVNVALPALPLFLILVLSRVLDWKKGILDLVADGQLYFFSAALCGVFLYDALQANKLGSGFFVAFLFVIIVLAIFYSAAMFMTHAPNGVAAMSGGSGDAARRRLANISISVTVIVLVVLIYERWQLELLS